MTNALATFLKPRLRAGGVHLLGSALLASLVTLLVFCVWYPAPLATAQGVSGIVLMLIAIDVVIGPMVTTLVFKRGKKGMLMDMIIIVSLQLAAMLYGVHTIFIARPALIVFNIDRFDVVAASEMQPEGLALARAQGGPGLPWFGPRVEGANLPTDQKQRNALLFSVVKGGPDIPQLAQWHVPYEQVRKEVIARAHPLLELKALNGMSDAEWQAFTADLQNGGQGLGYLPMRAKARDGAVIVDRHSAAVVKIVLLNPKWR